MTTKKTTAKTATKKTSAKKPAAKRAAAASTAKAPAKKSTGKKATRKLTGEARYLAIQKAAYYIAENANWKKDAAACWLEAEAEIAKKFGA